MRLRNAIQMFLVLGLMMGLQLLPLNAAELIMMEQKGCHWCERWHAEIGPIYPKTDEGKRAPLRSIDIHQALPDDLSGIRVARFTPSFVLVEDGVELGRIRGYAGDELFWWALADLIKKLPVPPGSPKQPFSAPLAPDRAART